MKGKKTGGRKKGTRNKLSMAQIAATEKAAAKIEAAIPRAFKGDAHALLMCVYKDTTNELAIRIDAAKGALPFEKARLSPIEPAKAGDGHVPLADRLKAYQRRDAIEDSKGKVIELKGKK